MAAIEIKNVSYLYNAEGESPVKAVDDVSLTIEEGEFVALVGHNGSGKSTMARLLNGLLVPSSGHISVFGKRTDNPKELFDIRASLGVVFQNPDNQMIATVIEDDIAFGPENLGLKSAEIRERVDWALRSVGMYEYKDGAPFRLSGGQKQRVAIAGVLAIKPRVMVLDESTSMLDPSGRREVLEVIDKLNKEEKMTVIMITHFMEEAARADRIIVMDGGKVIMDGGKEVFENEEKIKAAGLEIPATARIAALLREKGLDLPRGILTADRLGEELCRLK